MFPAVPSRITCPICGKPFDPQDSRAMPFCSPRCKLIDLGHWLDEKYGIPYERPQPVDPQPGSAPPQSEPPDEP